MALDNFKNFAKVTVSIGYDASATSIVLSSGHGTKLPTAPFNAVWWNATDYGDPSDDPNVEIVRVTNIATDTLTVTRAQESTSASTKNTASKAYQMIAGITAKTLNDDMGGGGAFTLVSYSTHTSNSFAISSLDLEADKEYMVIIKFKGNTAGTNVRFRFNADSGSNYYTRNNLNGSYSTGSGTSGWIAGNASTFQYAQSKVWISKWASQNTMVHSTSILTTTTGSTQPDYEEAIVQYNSTTNVTSMSFLSGNASDVWDIWIFKPNTA